MGIEQGSPENNMDLNGQKGLMAKRDKLAENRANLPRNPFTDLLEEEYEEKRGELDKQIEELTKSLEFPSL